MAKSESVSLLKNRRACLDLSFQEDGEAPQPGVSPSMGSSQQSFRRLMKKRSSLAVLMNTMEEEEQKPATFGAGSVFDCQVWSATELPYVVPTENYLQETLVGMLGAPSNDEGDKLDSLEQEQRRWVRMKKLFSEPSTGKLAQTLFWVVVLSIFREEEMSDSEEALQDLRRMLADHWLALNLGLGREAPKFDDELGLLPVALAQVVFRLVVDAFPDDRDSLTRNSKKWFEKVMNSVHTEFWGFKASRASSHITRSKLFLKAVVDHPHMNQQETMLTALRREKANATRDQPLAFGSTADAPLDDVQMLALMQWRESQRARSQPFAERQATSATNFCVPDTTMSHTAFLPVGAEELNVDRYEHLEREAQELMMEQGERIEQSFRPTLDQADCSPTSRIVKLSPQSSKFSGSMTRGSVQISLDSAGDESRNASMMRQQRRRSQQAQRRRRDDRLQELLAAPDTQPESMTTTFVSPLIDRLAPSDGDRSLLKKPHNEGRTVNRIPAHADGPLHWDTMDWNWRHDRDRERDRRVAAAKAKSKAPPPRKDGPRGAVVKAFASNDSSVSSPSTTMPSSPENKKPGFKALARLAKVGGVPQVNLPSAGRAAAVFVAAANAATVSASLRRAVSDEDKVQETLPWDRDRVSSQVVEERLRQQAEAGLRQAFTKFKNPTTGLKPEKLAADESAYVNKMQRLLTSRGSGAQQMLRPDAYQTRRAAPDGRGALFSGSISSNLAQMSASKSTPGIQVKSSLSLAGSFFSLGSL